MEPVSTITAVAGLISCLNTTLRTLNRFTYNSTSGSFGNSYAQVGDSLNSLYQGLIHVQRSLYANPKYAQVEKLLDVLQDIENGLDNLREAVQSVDTHRKIRLFRRSSRRRDTEAALTSILLAKNMIQMIKTLQGHDHRADILTEGLESRNQASLEYLTTALKPKYYWPLLKAPDTKAQEMFAWISGPEGQEKLHEQCRAERIAGTCEWFLAREEFQSWLRRPSYTGDDAIFWCQGRPGIGKTMLASKVIDQLQPLHVVAYFYMSGAKVHSASDLVTNLLRQLCLPFHIMPNRLQQIFEQSNGEPGYRLKLGDLLEALKEASHSIHQPTTIIIDGLDETNIREQSDFVQVFDSLKDTSWKCLVTSRDTQYLLPKAYNSFSKFVIEDDANERDIYNFVKSVLDENEPVNTMLNGVPEFRNELINKLTSRAHGMFYWVTLQVRLVLDQTHLSGIRCALDSIPSDIGEIVNSTLRMIKLQDENRAELANRALALLTAAQAPLTAEAMCHALGLAHVLDSKEIPSELSLDEVPNPESIIECCMGLIKMEPTTRVVMLAHYDILQEMREQWVRFFAPAHTARLAKTCIAYLSLAEFSRGPCHEMDTFRRRLEEYPFLDYASHYWGYHARAALLLGADVIDDIQRLLSQKMNLGLSLQVSEYDPESKQKTLAMHPDHFLEVSELQIASRHGLSAIVKSLLSTSLDTISSQDLHGRTALHEAAQAGWEDIVRMLIEARADPSLSDQEGKTPFVYAAERGHGKIISILRSGHDQQALEEAFCDAAEAGKTSVVEELHRLGVNPNARNSKSSAITVASRRGHKRVVRLLLDEGASASHPENSPSDSIPLHQAIRNDHVEIAALLLDFGANIEARDNSGRTALFETLGTPDTRGAALLLKNGIDIFCSDWMGDNVLHEAARRGAVEHASRFVDRGMDINIPNHDGLTPLHLAAQYGHIEIAKLLLQKGANINGRDSNGWSPLMHAVSAGNLQLSEMLLVSGVSLNALELVQVAQVILAGETGHHRLRKSPVDYGPDTNVRLGAVSSGQSEIVRLDQGAETNERSNNSRTPPTLAAEAGHFKTLRLLIERGADSNYSTLALRLTAEAGHSEVLELLLDYRGKFGVTDKDLETAMKVAREAGQEYAVKLLSDAKGLKESSMEVGR